MLNSQRRLPRGGPPLDCMVLPISYLIDCLGEYVIELCYYIIFTYVVCCFLYYELFLKILYEILMQLVEDLELEGGMDPLKGNRGQVVAVNGQFVRVELESQMNVVTGKFLFSFFFLFFLFFPVLLYASLSRKLSSGIVQ